MDRSEREETGWKTPADGWFLVLALEGLALCILEAARFSPSIEGAPAVGSLAPFGALFMMTGFLFCGLIPQLEDAAKPGRAARIGHFLLRLLPSPTPNTRAAALLAGLLPFLQAPQPFRDGLSIASLILTTLLIPLTYLGARATSAAVTILDMIMPFAMGALTMIWALAAQHPRSIGPGMASVGLMLTWFAHLLFLRQAASRHWAALAVRARAARTRPADLARIEAYAAELDRGAAPPPPAKSPAEGGAVLVDTGSLRVDTARMLDKLRERQLADARDFVLAWLRCAVASGAGKIELSCDWGDFRLTFDGRPFSAAELRDPYQALLDPEAPEALRGAQLAYGLLACLRFKPTAIWVFSGPPESRLSLSLDSRAGKGPMSTFVSWPVIDPGQGTLLHARFPGLRGVWRAMRFSRRALGRFWRPGVVLSVQRYAVSDPFHRALRNDTLESEGWRFGWQQRPGEVISRIKVYHLGALVEELDERLDADEQLDAAMSNDGLRLDISQSSVLRDALLKKGLARLEKIARHQV